MPQPVVKLGPGFDLAFSPDGRYLATMPSASPVKLFQTRDWSEVSRLDGLRSPREVFFFNHSKSALVASQNSKVATFSIPEGRLIRTWKTPHHEFGAISLTPDQTQFVVSSYSHLHFYDLDTGQELDQMPIGEKEYHAFGKISNAVYSRNGRYLAILWSDHDLDGRQMRLTVRSWPAKRVLREFNVDMGVEECSLRTSSKMTSIYTSYGGDGIAGAHDIVEWCLSNGSSKRPYSLKLPKNAKNFNFQFSTCGKRLIVMHDGTVKAYSADGQTLLAHLEIKNATWVFDAQFSPDLKYLATGTGAVHVWDADDIGI